jgi:predicted dehydrogenase
MSRPDPVRFGVIGAGWFASRRHLPDIQRNEHAALAALCRRDERALARVAACFEPERTYTDWRAMLDECPLDAVLIATPNAQHCEQARAAIDRGLHVLVEKPMAVTSAEANDLCERAARKGVHLAVALNPPHWSHCHRLRHAIRSGKIGDIEAIDIFWTGDARFVFGDAPPPAELPGVVPPTLYRADPEQCGGGYFVDGGSHLVSEALWVTGLRAVRVTCVMDRLPSDRRAALSVQLSNGATATITCVGDSRFSARRARSVFAGSRGAATIEGSEFVTTVHAAADEPQTFQESELPPVSGPVANLVEAIRGEAELYSPGAHGAHVVEVVEAAYRSAATGAAVSL